MAIKLARSAAAAAKKARFADQVRFFGALVRSPKHTGAVAPTSQKLGRLMASHIQVTSGLPVLELGPGTGAITSAILQTSLPPGRLYALEYAPKLARSLRAGFPGVHVIEGDAFNLPAALGDDAPELFDCVISGLPLLNFRPTARLMMIRSALALLPRGRPFIQFSYGVKPPVRMRNPCIETSCSPWIFGNVPPARVWTYRLTS